MNTLSSSDYTAIKSIHAAARAALSQPPQAGELPPQGHCTIEHDGFTGDVIGHYKTREGKEGVVMQQVGTRVVHVYGTKWLAASPTHQPEKKP